MYLTFNAQEKEIFTGKHIGKQKDLMKVKLDEYKGSNIDDFLWQCIHVRKSKNKNKNNVLKVHKRPKDDSEDDSEDEKKMEIYSRNSTNQNKIKASNNNNTKQFNCLGVKSILRNNSLLPGIPNYAEASEWLQQNYIPTDDEIWIITYTKCGTTLTQQICHEIMHCYYVNTGQNSKHSYYAQTKFWFSILEWIEGKRGMGLDKFNQHLQNTNNTKRIWKTHASLNSLPCRQLPKKMIIVSRNPKDALVSFYYHVKNARGNKVYDFQSGFKELFMIWSIGLMECNSYFQFYKEYWDFYNLNKDIYKDIDVLWLHYEDFVVSDESKRKQIKKMIKFMGVDEFVNTDEDISSILKNTSVEKMKKQYDKYVVKDFVRKGVIGDWKKHFDGVQNTLINGLINVTFNNTEFKYYKDLKDKKDYLCLDVDDDENILSVQ